MNLETAHLRLVPVSPGQLLALLEGPHEFERASGLRAAEGLCDFGSSNEISPVWLAKLRIAKSADPWVHGFVIVERESNLAIGTCGFKGPPDHEGMVEIAYGVVPAYRGKGYATEAAEALVKFALGSGQVQLVRAHTFPSNDASMRVLEKCGFKRLREVIDPEDGRVWRFERVAD
jgi:ribosomal-protein-alanine N-acetyltransferase